MVLLLNHSAVIFSMVFSYILFSQQTADVTKTYLRNRSKQQPCRLRKWHEKTQQHALQHYNMRAFEGLSLTNGPSYISQGNTSCENTQFFQHTVRQLHLTRTDHFLIVQLSITVVTQLRHQKSNL